MKDKSILKKCYIVCTVIFLLFTTSCVPYSKLRYFKDIDQLSEPVTNPLISKTINPLDKLQISVLSTDEKTANLLNASNQGIPYIAKGYVVDETGFITYPFVGRIKVGGFTLLEAGTEITKALHDIITRPEVVVSYMDNKVTVMGEVMNQGRYLISEDFINIYDALALGGGLSTFADREKVILLRKENNKVIHYKLNLSDSKISSSLFYYIIPNDVIIVEPLRMKSQQSPMITTVLSTLTTLISIVTLTLTMKSLKIIP